MSVQLDEQPPVQRRAAIPTSARALTTKGRRFSELYRHFESLPLAPGQQIDAIDKYDPQFARPCMDPVLNALCQLGVLRLKCDRAFISLIDDEKQYVIAEMTKTHDLLGSAYDVPQDALAIGVAALDLDAGICAGTMHTFTDPDGCRGIESKNIVANGTKFIIKDLTLETMYSQRPYVAGFPHMRFYAEVPLFSDAGELLGSYALLDTAPRDGITEEQFKILTDIAVGISNQIELVRSKEMEVQASQLIKSLDSLSGESFHASDSSQHADSRSTYVRRSSDLHYGLASALSLRQQESIQSCKSSLPAVTEEEADAQSTIPGPHIERIRNSSNSNPLPLELSDRPSTPRESKHHERLHKNFGAYAGLGNEIEHSNSHVQLPQDSKDFLGPPNPPSSEEEHDQNIYNQSALRIREALDLDGVKFVSLGSNDSRLPSSDVRKSPNKSEDDLHDQHQEAAGDLGFAPMTTERNKSDISPSPYSCTCEELGSNVRRWSSISPQNPNKEKMSTLPHQLYTELLRSYPGGCILRLDRLRRAADEMSETSVDLNGALLAHFPRACSVIFLPLWQGRKQHQSISAVAWSNSETRELTATEAKFFNVFGKMIVVEKSRLQLVAIDRMKSDFMSSISHELRSPLHGILGSVDILRESISPDLLNVTDMIGSCAGSLLNSVTHILDYSKISQTPSNQDNTLLQDTKRKVQEVDMATSLLGSIQSVLQSRHHRSVELSPSSANAKVHDDVWSAMPEKNRYEAGADPKRVLVMLNITHEPTWTARIDINAWQQSILHITDNAVKFTDTGLINIEAKLNHGNHNETTVVVTIRDTGRGIGPEYLEASAFTAFTQEDSVTDGTGLGLSLTRQLLQDAGGDIEVVSDLDQGTQATITLPISVAPTSDWKQVHAVRSHLLGLLVIENNTDKTGTTLSTRSLAVRSSFENTITTYAHDWLGLDLHPVSPSEANDVDVLIALEDDLSLLMETRTPLIIICSSGRAEALRNYTKSSKTFILPSPFGPDQFAWILSRAAESRVEADESKRTQELRDQYNIEPDQQPPSQISPSISEPDSAAHQGLSTSSKIGPVLLVDDNPVNLALLERAMQKNQEEYVLARNGREAVEAYTATPKTFRCIVMDISMPIMDGYEATRKIRELERERNPTAAIIVAVTGLSDKEAHETALLSGMDTVVTKPASMHKIREVLRKLLGQDS